MKIHFWLHTSLSLLIASYLYTFFPTITLAQDEIEKLKDSKNYPAKNTSFFTDINIGSTSKDDSAGKSTSQFLPTAAAVLAYTTVGYRIKIPPFKRLLLGIEPGIGYSFKSIKSFTKSTSEHSIALVPIKAHITLVYNWGFYCLITFGMGYQMDVLLNPATKHIKTFTNQSFKFNHLLEMSLSYIRIEFANGFYCIFHHTSPLIFLFPPAQATIFNTKGIYEVLRRESEIDTFGCGLNLMAFFNPPCPKIKKHKQYSSEMTIQPKDLPILYINGT